MYIPISECKIVFKTIHEHVYETLDLQSFKYMYTDVSMYMEFNLIIWPLLSDLTYVFF